MPTVTFKDRIDPKDVWQTSPQYKNPTEAILGNVSAKTNYFIQGAQRVAASKDSAENFGMNLTKEKYKNQFLEKKEKDDLKLKEMSNSNFAINSNVSQAMNVYDDIVKDVNFLKDSELTKRMETTYSSAKADANKKGSTSGYNADFVNYNRLMQDRYRKSDFDDYDFYLTDKFVGAYQSTPTKEMEDYTRNLQKELTKTIKGTEDDPNNPYAQWDVEKTTVDQTAALNKIVSSIPENLKNQMEVQARLKLLQAQQYYANDPNALVATFKDPYSYIVNDKKVAMDRDILIAEAQLAAINPIGEARTIAEENIANAKLRRTNMMKKFNEIDWTMLGNSERLKDAFLLVEDVEFNTKASMLASSVSGTIAESRIRKDNKAEYNKQRILLQTLKLMKDKKDGGLSNRAEGFTNMPVISPGEDVAEQSFDALTTGKTGVPIVDFTKNFLDQNLNMQVEENGTLIPLSKYIETHPEVKLSTLKDKMSEEAYTQLVGLSAYTYAKDGKHSTGVDAGGTVNIPGYENMTLGQTLTRVSHSLTDPKLFDEVVKQSSIKMNKSGQAFELSFAMNQKKDQVTQTNERGATAIRQAFAEHQGIMINTSGAKAGTENIADYLDFDKYISNHINWKTLEGSVGRTLTQDEKNRIVNYATDKNKNVEKLGEIPGITRVSKGEQTQTGKYYGFETSPKSFEAVYPVALEPFNLIKDVLHKEAQQIKDKSIKIIRDRNIVPVVQGKNFAITTGNDEKYDRATQINTQDLNTLIMNATRGGMKEETFRVLTTAIQNSELINNITFFNPPNADPFIRVAFTSKDIAKYPEDLKKIIEENGNKPFNITIPREIAKNLSFVKNQGDYETNKEIQTYGKRDFTLLGNNTLSITKDKSLTTKQPSFLPNLNGDLINVEELPAGNITPFLNRVNSQSFSTQAIDSQALKVAMEATRLLDFGKEVNDVLARIPSQEIKDFKKEVGGKSFIDLTKVVTKYPKLIEEINSIKHKYGVGSQTATPLKQRY